MEGKVYITNGGCTRDDEYSEKLPIKPAELLECEYSNEFIVDVTTTHNTIFALSDTGRLHTCEVLENECIPQTENPYFVDFDPKYELGLPSKPRTLTLTAGPCFVACLLQDHGVVAWEECQDPPEAVLVPRVSNSLDPNWKVMDLGVLYDLLELVLANGHIDMVELYGASGEKTDPVPERLEFKESVERVWSGLGRFFLLSRKKNLFEICRNVDPGKTPSKVRRVKDGRSSSIGVGCNHKLALMEDGTLYAWGSQFFKDGPLGLGPEPGNLDVHVAPVWGTDMYGQVNVFEPTKVNLDGVVSVVARHQFSAAIVLDPNAPGG